MSEEHIGRDEAMRARALHVDRSFIVQAPAGSGKTDLLIQRFLALLAVATAPEEIIAITFTRKAAGEMRTRVLNALRTAGERVGQSQHERETLKLATAVLEADARHGWGLTDNPARLRIQTIDSLCYALAAQMPLLSRLGAPAATEEDASALYRTAARETLALLEDAEWSSQVAALLRHLDNDIQHAEELLAKLLERRDQWLRHRLQVDREGLSRALANLIRERLTRVREAVPAEIVPDLMFCVHYARKNLSSDALRDGSTAELVLPGIEPEHASAWRDIASLLLTDRGEPRRQADVRVGFPPSTETGISTVEVQRRAQAKQRTETLYRRLAALPALVNALAEVKRLPVRGYSEEQWKLMEAVHGLLPLALAQLELTFRSANVVDFPQLLLSANQALGDTHSPTELALALDYRIRHLLIDEFQDTSLSQFELIERLTAGWQPVDGRTLFVVGDPMQSIYRFREAEVSLFLRAQRAGIGDVPLEPLTLSRNFRSQSGIVDWVNRVFEKVLPAQADPGTGAVPFAASFAVHMSDAELVTVHAVTGDSRDEARRVVALLSVARTEDETQRSAVLVRSRSQLNAIVPALKEARIPFRAIDVEPLAHRPAVQDLHALTRALLHPADRTAWFSVLRAPWCGLTLRDLEKLAGDERDALLWARLTDAHVCTMLTVDGQARATRVVEALAPFQEHRGRDTLRRRVEGAWLRIGGPATVQERADLDDIRVYLDLLEKLERGADLEDLGELEAELAKLYALPDSDAPEALQLMTIHKAKGLEFDTVIVPGLSFSVRQDEPELLRWIERPRGRDGSDFLLATLGPGGSEDDPMYACVTRLLRQQQEHEDGRLLYVAATRARRRLHLLAQVKIDRWDRDHLVVSPPKRNTLLAKLWPALKTDFERALLDSGPKPSRTNGPLPADPMSYPLRRLVLDWKAPPFPPPVGWRLPLQTEEVHSSTVEFSWAGEAARHVGTVVHRLLQRIADEGLAAWDLQGLPALDQVLSLALKQEGVREAEREVALTRVRHALFGVLRDPRGRWLLGSQHRYAHSEYRLSGELNGAFVSIVLDRTFVDEQGVRWIVDYKTGTHEGANVEAFLDRERERYRDQLERYAALLARIESRPIRLGLYFPLLKGWREWETRTHSASPSRDGSG